MGPFLTYEFDLTLFNDMVDAPGVNKCRVGRITHDLDSLLEHLALLIEW